MNRIIVGSCALVGLGIVLAGCKGSGSGGQASSGGGSCGAGSLKVDDQGFCVNDPGWTVLSKEKKEEGTEITLSTQAKDRYLPIMVKPNEALPDDATMLTSHISRESGDKPESGQLLGGKGKWASVVHGTSRSFSVLVKGPKGLIQCEEAGRKESVDRDFEACKTITPTG
jgi:hypothetical protein